MASRPRRLLLLVAAACCLLLAAPAPARAALDEPLPRGTTAGMDAAALRVSSPPSARSAGDLATTRGVDGVLLGAEGGLVVPSHLIHHPAVILGNAIDDASPAADTIVLPRAAAVDDAASSGSSDSARRRLDYPPHCEDLLIRSVVVFHVARPLGPPHHRRLSKVPAASSSYARAPAAALPSEDDASDGDRLATIFFWIACPFLFILACFVGCLLGALLEAIFRKVAALLTSCVAHLCAGDDDEQDGAEDEQDEGAAGP